MVAPLTQLHLAAGPDLERFRAAACAPVSQGLGESASHGPLEAGCCPHRRCAEGLAEMRRGFEMIVPPQMLEPTGG